MRIIQLMSENVKRLKAVAITPDRSVIRITGANGSGKSSLIDSIYYAIAGASGHPSQPIRHGEQRAVVRIDLGDYVVTRRFTPSGTSLEVTSREGAVFKSPQTLLDALGDLMFDPLSFSRLPPHVQLEQLRALVYVDLDLDELDARVRSAYDERTDINRRVKSLTESVRQMEPSIDPAIDVEPVDVSSLLDRMERANAHNETVSHLRFELLRNEEKRDALSTRIAGISRQIAALQEELNRAESDRRALEQALPLLAEIPHSVDTAEIRKEIDTARQANAERETQRLARNKHHDAVNELQAAILESQNLSNFIEDAKLSKAEAIGRANLPVAGLSFGEGEVTYNDVPFAQASSAEQIRVATAIGMALNPKLRILCIRDGSLLDENSLAMLERMAEENDFQVWIEQVNTNATVGFHMVDGAVDAIDGAPVDAGDAEAA